MEYNASNWYWTIGGDTANVWSSKRAASVPTSDAEYADWKARGGYPTPIPSMHELENVLAEQFPAGSLVTYNNSKRWQKEQAGITTSFGMPIKTNDRAQAKITGAWSALTHKGPPLTTQWHAADGTVHEIDETQIEQMNVDLLTHINASFETSANVLAAIADGSITSHEEIDAAYAAQMTSAQKNWLTTTHTTKKKHDH